MLLENGVDVHVANTVGETALHVAAFRGNLELAELLLEKRALAEAKNNKGNTCSQVAAENSFSDLVEGFQKFDTNNFQKA